MDREIEKQFRIAANNPTPIFLPEKSYRRFIKGVNGEDGMSPYKNPSSIGVFNDIADVINKKAFEARYTQMYTPIAGYFRKFNIPPFFNPEQNEGWSKGLLTIAGMIELVNMGEHFQLLRDQDFDPIIAVTQSYYDSIIKFPDQSLKVYASKVKPFLEVMKEGRRRMLKRNGKDDTYADFTEILSRVFGLRS